MKYSEEYDGEYAKIMSNIHQYINLKERVLSMNIDLVKEVINDEIDFLEKHNNLPILLVVRNHMEYGVKSFDEFMKNFPLDDPNKKDRWINGLVHDYVNMLPDIFRAEKCINLIKLYNEIANELEHFIINIDQIYKKMIVIKPKKKLKQLISFI